MNLTRLMALGTLALYGPTHGHQIRRLADVSNAGEWSGVSPGALYRELRLMEGEGLVEALRTEQIGRRPARTVYAITGDGRLELGALRVQAIRSMDYGPDGLGVALTFAFEGADREELRDLLRARRDRCAISARELETQRERGLAAGYLTPVEAAVMRRGVLHAEAEVAWHDDFDKLLAALPGEQPEGPAWGLSRHAGWRAPSPAGSARSRRSAGWT
ncbi:MAG TPA: PadR family transcriptional regulator [Streptosporangiaceae bacterium]|nr:PadR family transcriptional regulator [Streptosporangiaceae bacterium]